jgi:hypothetical protein
MTSSFFRLAGLSLAFVVLSVGCVAEVRGRPGYVYATYEPRDIDRYPQTVYDGRRVYYVDGYWYTREGPRWIYLREEPRPLYEFRLNVRSSPRYERRYRREDSGRRDAPPSRERRHSRRRDAPPADDRDPPPAVRIR